MNMNLSEKLEELKQEPIIFIIIILLILAWAFIGSYDENYYNDDISCTRDMHGQVCE